MTKLSTIELSRESMGFSAGHFTIFSATERENLHGHNYQVYAALTTEITENGLTFDYRDYKNTIRELCSTLDQCFLIAERSPHCEIEYDESCCYVLFNKERIPFLKKDIRVLPISNITLEELSSWFLQHLTKNKIDLNKNKIQKIVIKVATSPGQWGSATWTRD